MGSAPAASIQCGLLRCETPQQLIARPPISDCHGKHRADDRGTGMPDEDVVAVECFRGPGVQVDRGDGL